MSGGCGSALASSREIESTGIRFGSVIRRGCWPTAAWLNAPPHKISIDQTVAMAPDFELLGSLYLHAGLSMWMLKIRGA